MTPRALARGSSQSARARFRRWGWDFLKEDATRFNLKKLFDYVLLGSAYHHIIDDNKRKMLVCVNNHVAKTGKVIVCDNFLPKYDSLSARQDAIREYYETLIGYYLAGNATREGIEIIKEVYQLELRGEEEHKVDFQRFQEDVIAAGLEIEVDRIIWQPGEFVDDNAGSHVLLLRKQVA